MYGVVARTVYDIWIIFLKYFISVSFKRFLYCGSKTGYD